MNKTEVRLRRAYFDTRFGQLHVRTAFPGTGGFDEHTTLFCVHAAAVGSSSRDFAGLLGLLAADRSVYAPDRPGYGESDEGGARDVSSHALALADLAADLRLRRIDLLGAQEGAAVAAALAAAQPQLVRRVVLLAQDAALRGAAVAQPVLRVRLGGEGAEFAADACSADPQGLARAVRGFLDRP